jgi:hypothetical protein
VVLFGKRRGYPKITAFCLANWSDQVGLRSLQSFCWCKPKTLIIRSLFTIFSCRFHCGIAVLFSKNCILFPISRLRPCRRCAAAAASRKYKEQYTIPCRSELNERKGHVLLEYCWMNCVLRSLRGAGAMLACSALQCSSKHGGRGGDDDVRARHMGQVHQQPRPCPCSI